jgi:hypothetical protein
MISAKRIVTPNISKMKGENIEVKVQEKRSQAEIPLPMLTKSDEGYEMLTQDEMCKKLFLKVDEDDPVIKLPDKFEMIEKKGRKN